MGSLPRHNAVIVITHPGGGKSFDYDDYWDGADLIYTGKGQRGDQKRTGENRYVGDNSRTLLVFEQAGPAQLRYVGSPRCVKEWPETAPDGASAPRHSVPPQVRDRACARARARPRRHPASVSRPGTATARVRLVAPAAPANLQRRWAT
jgi:hypothetical protein